MKNIYIIIAGILTGCTISVDSPKEITGAAKVSSEETELPYISVVTIDSCEYVLWHKQENHVHAGSSNPNNWTASITHKGNCKYCIERNPRRTESGGEIK